MRRFQFLCLTGLILLSGTARSGPLFDPFLEKFQVGTYSDPADIDLSLGYPADLMEAVVLDIDWLQSAGVVLDARDEDAHSFVTHGLLEGHLGEIALEAWLGGMGALLGDLEAGTESMNWAQDTHPLRKERATAAVFGHLEAGRTLQAAALAIRLRDGGRTWGLADREIFIWDLRAKFLFRKAGNQSSGDIASWPTMLPLGPYDILPLVEQLKILFEIGYTGCVSLELYNPAYRKREPNEFLREAHQKTLAVIEQAVPQAG